MLETTSICTWETNVVAAAASAFWLCRPSLTNFYFETLEILRSKSYKTRDPLAILPWLGLKLRRDELVSLLNLSPRDGAAMPIEQYKHALPTNSSGTAHLIYLHSLYSTA